MKQRLCLLVALLLGAPPLIADDAATLIRHRDWKDANKSVKKAFKRLAKNQSGSPEEIARLARVRALAEAGQGHQRLADWYWWTSALFDDWPTDASIRAEYGDSATPLFELRRPLPPSRKVKLNEQQLQAFTRELTSDQRSMPTLRDRACRGLEGVVTFEVTIAADGYFQAPRPAALGNAALPICVFAILERHRDTQYRSLPEGRVTTMRERLETRREARP